MKRYIKSNQIKNKIEVEIIAICPNLASYDIDLAASKKVNLQYRNLKSEWQLTSEQFEAWKNFINSVVAIITKFGFGIVDDYQSGESYSYYVQFTPQPYLGFEDEMLELDVKFRLSDHYQDQRKEKSEHTASYIDRKAIAKESKNSPIFTSFVVEGIKCDDIAATLLRIKNICQDLKVGDYSKLL